MVNTIGACGFSATGSSAVLDYLKEFDENYVLGDLEFTISHTPDGLQDLRYHLFEGSTKYTSSAMALERFKRLTHGYPSRMYKRSTRGNMRKYADEFVKEITQCEWYGSSITDQYYEVGRARLIRILKKYKISALYRRVEELLGHDASLYPYMKRSYSCRPEKFDIYAQEFIAKLLYEFGWDGCKNIVLDQPFAGNNPQASFPFFNNPLAIVVDRDPRDCYLMSKEFYYRIGWRVVPCSDVASYITYYRSMRESMPYLANDDRILRVCFEDMIYRYEETTDKIRDFCGLTDHMRPRECFDPAKSINNTNLAPMFPERAEEIEIIERELSEYLYPFDEFSEYGTKEEKNFFG